MILCVCVFNSFQHVKNQSLLRFNKWEWSQKPDALHYNRRNIQRWLNPQWPWIQLLKRNLSGIHQNHRHRARIPKGWPRDKTAHQEEKNGYVSQNKEPTHRGASPHDTCSSLAFSQLVSISQSVSKITCSGTGSAQDPLKGSSYFYIV